MTTSETPRYTVKVNGATGSASVWADGKKFKNYATAELAQVIADQCNFADELAARRAARRTAGN